MVDVSVEAENEKDLERIQAEITAALKLIKGVTDTEHVDCDLENEEED